LNFAEIFGTRKLESLGIICVMLRLIVSVEHRLVTVRQTDRHTTTAYTGLAWRRAVKIVVHTDDADADCVLK